MRRLRAAVFVAISVAGFGGLVGYLTEPNATLFYHASFEPEVDSLVAQAPLARRWHPVEWKDVFALGPPFVNHPDLFAIASDGGLWVLEWPRFVLKRFSKEGHLISEIHLPRGEDPANGEVANPESILIGPDGNVWVCDIGGSFISFTPDGKVRTVIHQVAPDYRMAIVGDRIVALRAAGRSAPRFDIYSLSGTSMGSVDLPLVREQVRDGIVVDGFVAASPDGDGFLYVGRWVGVLASIMPDGRHNFIVRIADDLKPPMITWAHQRTRRVAAGTPETAIGVNAVGSDVFVVVGIQARNSSNGVEGEVVDVYDGHTGGYKDSFVLPAVCRAAAFSRDRAYLITGDRLAVWAR